MDHFTKPSKASTMRTSHSLLCLCATLLLLACQPTDSSQKTKANDNTMTAAYLSATVYAGSTVYRFMKADGEVFDFTDGNSEEAKIEVPANILEDPDEVDGPPGANPVLIAKTFLLHKDEEGEINKISLVPGQEIFDKAILTSYQSAAQYPAHTEYYFQPHFEEEVIRFSIDHDDTNPSIMIPSNLLEDPADLPEDQTMEGPNPRVMGLEYLLSYKGNKLAKVQIVPGQFVPAKVVEATYRSAAVYAGKIEYEFRTKDKKSFLVSDGVDEEATIEVPYNMLEDDEDLEGPPGANPEMVGKTLELHYDKQNRVHRILNPDRN